MALKEKNIFVVLGMARSGTSAITRGLNALGIQLGDTLTKPNKKWNPKGFWENSDVVYKINGKIFSALNFPIYNIRKLDRTLQLSNQLSTIRHSAIKLLKQNFSNTHYWGFKDPSTIKLLPFWQSIFLETQLNDHYVIALRNPLSVASSYQSLTGSDLETGLLLWLIYLIEAIDETQGKKRIIVSYELLLSDPKKELNRIKSFFNIPFSTDGEIDAYVDQFLDKKLHHFETAHDELKSHATISVFPLCLDVYQLLMQLAKNEISFSDNAFLNGWQNIKNELNKVQPIYCYIDTILRKVNILERTLRTIHKSILWKILSPFRKIDDLLRARRRKQREARRLRKTYA